MANNNNRRKQSSNPNNQNSFILSCSNVLKRFNCSVSDINIVIDKAKVSVPANVFFKNQHNIESGCVMLGAVREEFVTEKGVVRKIQRYVDPGTGKPILSIHAPYGEYNPWHIVFELHQPTLDQQALLANLFASHRIPFSFTYVEVALDFIAHDPVKARALHQELSAISVLPYACGRCGTFRNKTTYTNRSRKATRNRIIYIKRNIVRLEVRLQSSVLKRHGIGFPVDLTQFDFSRYIRFKWFDDAAFLKSQFRKAMKKLPANKHLLRHKHPLDRIRMGIGLHFRTIYNASKIDGFVLDHLLMNMRYAGYKGLTRWLRDLHN